MENFAVWSTLRHSRQHVRRLARRPTHGAAPIGTWACLSLIAVLGSAIYGGSLALVLPQWRVTSSALWMAVSAGLSWCIFGPVLAIVTRRPVRALVQACLVTMAYGEAVLTCGAALNALVHVSGRTGNGAPARANVGIVGFSNLVMAFALTRQLEAIGVPRRKTLLTWTLALDGSGAVFFRLFRGLLSRQT